MRLGGRYKGKSAVVTSKAVKGMLEDRAQGAVLGWLGGRVVAGSRGFRCTHCTHPPMVKIHRFLVPLRQMPPLSFHMPQVQCRKGGSGRGCLLPFPFSPSGQDKVGKRSSPAPNSQVRAATLGLMSHGPPARSESVFIPAPWNRNN